MKLLVTSMLAAVVSCSSNDNPPPPVENAGSSCTTPAQCYPAIDGGTLKGAVQCLSRVPGGYCTHLCTTDADCCAIPGECTSGFKQVCSPFESTGQMMCFLSCEKADIAAADAGAIDDTVYCQTYANKAMSCRSSGGGSANRKVCVP